MTLLGHNHDMTLQTPRVTDKTLHVFLIPLALGSLSGVLGGAVLLIMSSQAEEFPSVLIKVTVTF